MINDGTIKENVGTLERLEWLTHLNKEDYGYKIKYKSNPTIVSTNADAFVLNGVSTVDKIHGSMYLDRVYISKNATRAEAYDLMFEMIKAFRQNMHPLDLEYKSMGFEMPGYAQRYLREVAENPDIFELRFYAKGYPKS